MGEVSLPEGWKRVTLGEITEESGERVGRRRPIVLSSTKYHGLVPSEEYFRGRQVYSENISNYKTVNRNHFAYATNHLAEGSIGLQDKEDQACVSPVYTVFKCKEDVDPSYLWRILKWQPTVNSYKVHEQASVDRRGAIRYQDFSKIAVNIPRSIFEQQRIAEIFNAVDGQISANQRVVQKQETIKEAIRKDIFSGLDASNYPLGDLGEIVTGSTPPNEYLITEIGTPFVTPSELGHSDIIFNSPRNLSSGKNFHARLIPPGALLAVCIGFGYGKLGVSGVEMCTNQQINALIPNREIDVYFLYCALGEHIQKMKILSGLQVTPIINKSQFSTIKLPIPNQKVQKEIADKIGSIQSVIEATQKELHCLYLLKQALMDDLLTGRVRVPIEEYEKQVS